MHWFLSPDAKISHHTSECARQNTAHCVDLYSTNPLCEIERSWFGCSQHILRDLCVSAGKRPSNTFTAKDDEDAEAAQRLLN